MNYDSLAREWQYQFRHRNFKRANEIVNELRDAGYRVGYDPNRLGGVIAVKR